MKTIWYLTICFLLLSCGTESEPNDFEGSITRVEISPDPLTTNYTAEFHVILKDSLENPYRVAWQLEQPDGSSLDTLTETSRFYWTAPPQAGEYVHKVWLENETGQPLTSEHDVTVPVIPWNPPPSDTTLKGEIVFSAREGGVGEYQIFKMNADGTNLQQLTDWDSPSTGPSWSPDGKRVVFSSFHRANNISFPALWIMNADGSDARLIKEGDRLPLLGHNPRWSPNGSKIAYEFCPTCEGGSNDYDIYVYDFETDETKKFTEHLGSDRFVAWSPGGYKMTIASEKGNKSDIYMINKDGSGFLQLTHIGNSSFPIWHPNGYTIIFRSVKSPEGLYTINIHSHEVIPLLLREDFSENVFLYPHAWTPDGRHLLLGAWRVSTTWDYTFYLFNTETKDVQEIYTKKGFSSNSSVLGVDWFISTP